MSDELDRQPLAASGSPAARRTRGGSRRPRTGRRLAALAMRSATSPRERDERDVRVVERRVERELAALAVPDPERVDVHLEELLARLLRVASGGNAACSWPISAQRGSRRTRRRAPSSAVMNAGRPEAEARAIRPNTWLVARRREDRLAARSTSRAALATGSFGNRIASSVWLRSAGAQRVGVQRAVDADQPPIPESRERPRAARPARTPATR